MASVKLCPKCHTSITLTSYPYSFQEDSARAYQNPNDAETSYVEESLRTPSADLAALAQEISRVKCMLEALKTHHAHLDTYIQRSRQYIRSSPIRRLPTEVLGIIFAYACTSFQPSEYKTPLSISLVCSKWRDISLSTPSLWTHIYIAPYSGGLDVYNHFLERCGDIPLSVKVEIPYKDRPSEMFCDEHFPYEETREYHAGLVQSAYRNSAQWKVAELCMNQADVSLLDSQIGTPVCPLLESLTLVNDGPANFLEFDLFNEASLLTSCTFMVVGEDGLVDVECYEDALPWHQLREVCVRNDVESLSSLDNQFEDDSNRTLVFRPRLQCLNPPRDDVPCILCVTTLVLDSVIWTHSLLRLFSSIMIPTLINLTMLPPGPYEIRDDFAMEEWINPFYELPDFLNRSECTLQTFSVILRGRYALIYTSLTFVEPETLISTLRSMTNLQALHLIEADSGPLLLSEQLFHEIAERHLLPKLTSLELVWPNGHPPTDALITMLNSRCGQGDAGINSLSSVVLGVHDGGDLPVDVLDCMMGLRQRGIRATLW